MSINKRIEVLDIIRGVSIWMVILVHSQQKFSDLSDFFDILKFGQMGCQIFIVLSGFASMMSYRSKTPKEFYLKRYKSIAPGYYGLILLTFIIDMIVLNVFHSNRRLASNRNPAAVICNIFLLHGLFPFCNNNVVPGGWYVWTIVIFYIVTPVVFTWMETSKRIRYIPWIVQSSAVCLIFIFYHISKIDSILNNNSFIYFNFINQIGVFLLGAKLYFEYEKGIQRNKFDLVIAVMEMLFAVVLFYSNWKYTFIIIPYIVGLSAYHFIRFALSAEKKAFVNNKKTCLNILKNYGRCSYYIYLVHFFFAWIFVEIIQKGIKIARGGVNLNSNLLYFILIIPIFILSYFSAIMYEKICNKIIDRISKLKNI